jgi:hypothetical protein
MKELANKPSNTQLTASSMSAQTSGPAITTRGTLPTSLASGGSSALAANSQKILSTAKTSTAVTDRVAAGVAVVAPLTVGVIVGGVAAVCYGVANMIKYGESRKSGKQAVTDTLKRSAGLGVAAGLGEAAGAAIAGSSLTMGSTIVAPIAVGAAVACASIQIWNTLFFNGKKDLKTKSKTE